MGHPLPDETIAPQELAPTEERTRDEMVRSQALRAAAEGDAVRGPGRSPWLLADLEEHEAFLQQVSRHFRSVEGGEALSHAAEWLLDNFYLAQQSLRQIKEDMPRGYYRKLPKLVAGEFAGYPRSYQIAQSLITSNAGRLELDTLKQYVWFYQEAAPLTTGELWSLPMMLRLSVLDILAEALEQITGLARSADIPSSPIAPGLTNDEIVANCFTSLRAIANHDWRRFFEAVSRVEVTLRRDPPGLYARMDSSTRDHYRKIVEELALSTGSSEEEVARRAIALAGAPPHGSAGPSSDGGEHAETDWLAAQTAHVGYYLLGEGRTTLEAELAFHPPLGRRLSQLAYGYPTALYLGPILTLVALLLLAAYGVSRSTGATTVGQLMAVALSVIPALTVAVSAWDWFTTIQMPPRRLPKLNFEAGIPAQFRTVVVVPTLLTSDADIRSLMHQLEVSYLGNPDPNLGYALLTDFTDATDKLSRRR